MAGAKSLGCLVAAHSRHGTPPWVFPIPIMHHLAPPEPGMCAQVCRRWKQVLTNPLTSNELWREVIIDFGHELITAVHTPIAWSDRRPSDEEFRESFSHTRLSAARMVHFVEERQASIRRLVLMNSEGYWSGTRTAVADHFTIARFSCQRQGARKGCQHPTTCWNGHIPADPREHDAQYL